jgi:pimeloyl-ACP methyl ester carboxylesterase
MASRTSSDSPTSASSSIVVDEHRMVLPDGRTLAIAEFGDPGGTPVVLFPSNPGSRLLDPDPAATAAAHVRLLVVDRPGYGDSTPLPPATIPTLTACANDVAVALGVLGVDEVGVVGWSTGGRYALALAAVHPEVVRAVALAGTPAPDEALRWIPPEHQQLLMTMRADPASGVATMAEIFGPMGSAMAADPTQVGPAPDDARLLGDPAVRERVLVMLGEAFRSGVLGVAADIVAANVVAPGFDPAAIGAPVALFYGDGDTLIPPEHGRWWAGQLLAPTEHAVAGAGHLVLIVAWAEILASVV